MDGLLGVLNGLFLGESTLEEIGSLKFLSYQDEKSIRKFSDTLSQILFRFPIISLSNSSTAPFGAAWRDCLVRNANSSM